eukprot:359710-Chlamydomonas_euryale.AAC.10
MAEKQFGRGDTQHCMAEKQFGSCVQGTQLLHQTEQNGCGGFRLSALHIHSAKTHFLGLSTPHTHSTNTLSTAVHTSHAEHKARSPHFPDVSHTESKRETKAGDLCSRRASRSQTIANLCRTLLPLVHLAVTAVAVLLPVLPLLRTLAALGPACCAAAVDVAGPSGRLFCHALQPVVTRVHGHAINTSALGHKRTQHCVHVNRAHRVPIEVYDRDPRRLIDERDALLRVGRHRADAPLSQVDIVVAAAAVLGIERIVVVAVAAAAGVAVR